MQFAAEGETAGVSARFCRKKGGGGFRAAAAGLTRPGSVPPAPAVVHSLRNDVCLDRQTTTQGNGQLPRRGCIGTAKEPRAEGRGCLLYSASEGEGAA